MSMEEKIDICATCRFGLQKLCLNHRDDPMVLREALALQAWKPCKRLHAESVGAG